MYDLEDGVMPDKKNEARIALYEYLMHMKDVDKETSSVTKNINKGLNLLRINRYDTPWFNEDASLAYDMSTIGLIDGIVLPKINHEDVDDVSCHLLLQSRLNNLDSDTTTSISMANTTTTATATSPIPLWAMIETPRA